MSNLFKNLLVNGVKDDFRAATAHLSIRKQPPE